MTQKLLGLLKFWHSLKFFSLKSGKRAWKYLLIKVRQFFNKFKQSFDFIYSQFCSFCTQFALGKNYFWHRPTRAPQRKPAVKNVPLSQSEIVSYKNWTLAKMVISGNHNIPLFLQNPVIFFKKSTMFSCNGCLKEFIEVSFATFSSFLSAFWHKNHDKYWRFSSFSKSCVTLDAFTS